MAKILKVLDGVMVFARIWRMVGGRRRQPTSAQMFRQAQRLRDEGRFEDAAEIVESALLNEPGSVVGHLLAGSLHLIQRETGQARTSFERVLALEPTQPRALLGLARIAIEEGEPTTCRALLSRALARYPDFPEARALLEVARGLETSAGATRAVTPSEPIRTDRLRLPEESREAVFTRRDATLVFASPRGPRSEAVAAGAVKLARIATAMLARAGLGPLRHAVIEGAAETTYLRADDAAVLALAFDSDVTSSTAVGHLERVWDSCRSELA